MAPFTSFRLLRGPIIEVSPKNCSDNKLCGIRTLKPNLHSNKKFFELKADHLFQPKRKIQVFSRFELPLMLLQFESSSPKQISIQGSERELTNIDPVFKIYHDCDDGILVSYMKFIHMVIKMKMPKS